MGCDIVQGYYFSKPVPAGEFERFLTERRDRPAGLEGEPPGGITPDFAALAKALAQDYFIIYYVDVKTDYFIEYRAGDDFNKIGIEKQGEDFFNLSRRNIPRFTCAEDVPGFLEVFTKENVLHEVDNNGSFSVTYRMVMEGGPKYVMMKAARLDDRHIVIGTSNVNTEVQRQKAAMVRSSVAQALSSDYFLIFYIDTKTDRYIEYRPTESDTELDMEQGREDFFNTSRESIFTNVCEESREQVRRLFDKEHLLELLRENGSYTMDYRYLMNGVPTYIHMKASRMADRDDPHIVLGLRNIDERVRREQAQARALQKATELASRDGLTGVKSKRVFVEAEMQWDAGIEENKAAPFAVAVFDLNDLKTINDTMGHAAGDSYICDGCTLVCKTFQHSPVYRIGGDEFAAVLTGQDYEHRRELKESFRALNAARRAPEEAVVACGMADYVPGRDTRFQDVFERADADMYENKKFLKNNNKIGGIKP
jgi:diguanylate cyclase (GGDEF)-like protein